MLLHHSRSWNRMRTGHRYTVGSNKPTSGHNACFNKCAYHRFKKMTKLYLFTLQLFPGICNDHISNTETCTERIWIVTMKFWNNGRSLLQFIFYHETLQTSTGWKQILCCRFLVPRFTFPLYCCQSHVQKLPTAVLHVELVFFCKIMHRFGAQVY